MRVKTEDLTPNQLSYVVTKILHPTVKWGNNIGYHAHSNQIVCHLFDSPKCFSPYLSWGSVGRVLEEEKIELEILSGKWCATKDLISSGGHDTALEAVIKCFILYKVGKTVTIPKELGEGK